MSGESSFCSQTNMMKYIPGGIHKCMLDEALTILSMSESFLALFGYEEQEVHERFHDHFAEMICQNDREDVKRQMLRQAAKSDMVELEYRIQKKNGEVVWILDKGRVVQEQGGRVLYSMLLDVSSQKKEREELRLSLERFRVIMDQTADIIFEWDIKEDKLLVSHNWYKCFGYTPITHNVRAGLSESENIHPEDMAYLTELIEDARNGVPYSETEFRIRSAAGEFIDCRIRSTTQYDSEQNAVKAIGIISDIRKEKTQRQELIEQARRDSLTGLLHKNAAKKVIDDYLECTGSSQGVLLLIDLDDFKQVNDHYGHLCGDALLADTAGALRRVFRGSDVLSRVGGDEFLAFLPGISEEKVTERVRELRQALSEIRVEERAYLILCSVGAAIYPRHAADFNSLYRCADLALYQVKNTKKGETAFYSREMEKSGFSENGIKSAVNSMIDSNLGSVSELLGQYCFRMLYDSIELFPAVQSLLETIGRAYNVSRVYIFEDSDDGLTTTNTFEWCSAGVEPQIDPTKKIVYGKELENYRENFDENGVFYCGDVHRLPPAFYEKIKFLNVCSLLQCAIIDNGKFKGYVGFDECRKSRRWTQEQIESLSLVSKVLSTFLIKYRLQERVKCLEAELK